MMVGAMLLRWGGTCICAAEGPGGVARVREGLKSVSGTEGAVVADCTLLGVMWSGAEFEDGAEMGMEEESGAGVRGALAGMAPEAEDEREGVVVSVVALVGWGCEAGTDVGPLTPDVAARFTKLYKSPMSLASTSNVGRLWGSRSQHRTRMLL